MRKIITLIMLILALFLNACDKNEDPPIGDPDQNTYLYTHHVNKANFESFYEIDFNLEVTETGYQIFLEVTHKFDFEPEFLNVSFILYVTYQADNVADEMVHQYRQTQFKTFSHTFENQIDDIESAYVSEFDLTVTSGRVHTNRYIPIQTKEYPIYYEAPVDEIISIEIPDPVQNLANYEAFMVILDDFDQVDSDHLSFYYSESLTVQSQYQTYTTTTANHFQLSADPFYLAYESEGFKEIFMQSPYDEQMIYFNMTSQQMVNGRYIVRPIIVPPEVLLAFLTNIEIDDSSGPVDDYSFNPEIMRFESMTGGFLVSAYLKDFVSKEEYDLIVDAYVEMGIDPEVLEDTIVKFSLLSDNLSYRFNIEMVFDFEETYEQTITTKVDYIFDFKPFEQISLSSSSLYVMPPTMTENILSPIDPFVENVVLESPRPHVFKVYLEPGQYLMHTNHENIKIDVLDLNMQNADQFITYQNDYVGRFRKTFFIENEGYYYLRSHRYYYSGTSYTFSIEKLDFTSNIHEPIHLDFGQNHISIEHDMELVAYQFNAPRDMVIKVSGDAASLRYIGELSYSPDQYQLIRMFDFGEQEMFMLAKEGLNLIYFNNEQPIDFVLTIIDYGDLLYKSDDVSEMTSIGLDFLDEPMLIGIGFGSSYLRFDAIHGIYTFQFQKSFDFLHASIILIDANTHQEVRNIYSDSTSPIIIQAGNYYLKILASNVFEFNIKYEVTPYENPIILEEIESYPTYDMTNEDFPYFEGLLYDFYHKPVHRFTLDEPATIAISTNPYHHLYDSDGRLLTFKHLNNLDQRLVLYFLDAGTYDVIPSTWNPNATFLNYKLRIAVITEHIEQDNYYPKEPALFLNEGGTMNFVRDHWYDYDFIKVVITARVSYNLNGNRSFSVYDSDLNQIMSFSSNNTKQIIFEVGTYYIVTHLYPLGNFRLQIFPPEYLD
jgi:hypothetical protein